ncbi:hypothetical protein MMC22_006440 [Lobaria immixta]|nr:hypothetical protein [Lobaria immixta]
MTSSHSRVGDAPFAAPMLIKLTVKRMLWVLYQELTDLVPKPQSFTPSIYHLLHDASCVYLERKDPELTHILPLADFLSIHNPKLAESLYKVLLKTIDHVSESDKKEALPVAQKLAELYFDGEFSLSRIHRRGLAVSPAMPNWQEQQNVFCRALTDMELSLGYDHLDVLSYCSRLGEFYLHHGLDIDVERLFLRVYQGQRSVMGDGHEDTLCSLINIFDYYVDQERYLEAEALIQVAIVGTETIDTNHNAMSSNDQFVTMGCSTSLEANLASLCTPGRDYYWKDSRMYLRRFYEISLVPSLPPEIFPRRPVNVTVEGAMKSTLASESLSVFNFLSDVNLSTMKYTLRQQDVSTITLTVPYVPYQHFQRSTGYHYGFNYMEYMKLMTQIQHHAIDRQFQKHLYLRIKDNPRLPVLVPWVLDYDMPSVDADLIKNRQIEGFFNNIPGDSALLDLNNELGGFSLVSSSWIDWKNFTVHQVAPSHNPRLISNGKCMKCHGYIMGTWTEKSLRSQWTGIPIFIVDAIFTERESNKICNFILNPGVVGAHNQHGRMSTSA